MKCLFERNCIRRKLSSPEKEAQYIFSIGMTKGREMWKHVKFMRGSLLINCSFVHLMDIELKVNERFKNLREWIAL